MEQNTLVEFQFNILLCADLQKRSRKRNGSGIGK